jgi:type I restriction enzyme M protein
MLGAIIGDIVGSRFEWDNIKTKDFELLNYHCFFTDDSIMSLAVARAILDSGKDIEKLSKIIVQYMQDIGRPYPEAGYGSKFQQWLFSEKPQPYNSYGNGAAMRVSACGLAASTLNEAKQLAKAVTEITHNHPEGLKGAEAVAVAIFLAREGRNILEMRDYINEHYYPMNFTLQEIRDTYEFDETCQGTVPQAIMAFLESNSFEDAIRNAISIGGDSDTLAAITGGIAEAYYGITAEMRKHALTFLDEQPMKILIDFENTYTPPLALARGDQSVLAKRPNGTQNINTGERDVMIAAAADAADEDLNMSFAKDETTTSQKLFAHLFECCNILRGPINQDEYKSYVTPILFFKRLSDVYDEETVKALEVSGGDEEYAAFPENHSFIIPDGCHWQNVRETTENVGKAIADAMVGIERANPETLNGVFSSFDDAHWTDKSKLSDERLKDLVEHMSKIKVGNVNYSADVMGDSYEYLIKKFADLSKKSAGEFYTPRAVVKLMVKILDPKPGETVYDPACGTGGMLIEAIRNMKNDRRAYGKIYGQEKKLETSAIARMNLFLHGARDFHIMQGDTFTSPMFLHRGELRTFDCVIANPPFSLKKWGAAQFSTDPYGRNLWGTPSDNSADFAWLQHMVKSMSTKNGRCAVVLPQGVLFHGGTEGKIRQSLIESDILVCVIILVGGLFYSTGVSACILILDNNKTAEARGKVCFIDATKIYTAKRAQNIMTDKNIDEVFSLLQNYKDVVEKVKVATTDEIKNAGFVLTPPNYIEKFPQESINPKQVKKDFLTAFNETIAAEDKFKSLLKKGGYLSE